MSLIKEVFKHKNQKQLWLAQCKQWLPLLLILIIFILIFSTGLNTYLSFESLKKHHTFLLAWTHGHVYLSALIFVVIYTLAVAVSIPGATFLTLLGGFLFGSVFGSMLVVISATMGATLLYFAVKSSLGNWFAHKAAGWSGRMRQGFQKHAFCYLLFLRLVPIFPFWVINIVPSILGVRASTFVIATFLGIIPGSVIYVMLGSGLNHILASNQTPNLSILLDSKVLYPLLVLAVLSLLSVIYQTFFQKRMRP